MSEFLISLGIFLVHVVVTVAIDSREEMFEKN